MRVLGELVWGDGQYEPPETIVYFYLPCEVL